MISHGVRLLPGTDRARDEVPHQRRRDGEAGPGRRHAGEPAPGQVRGVGAGQQAAQDLRVGAGDLVRQGATDRPQPPQRMVGPGERPAAFARRRGRARASRPRRSRAWRPGPPRAARVRRGAPRPGRSRPREGLPRQRPGRSRRAGSGHPVRSRAAPRPVAVAGSGAATAVDRGVAVPYAAEVAVDHPHVSRRPSRTSASARGRNAASPRSASAVSQSDADDVCGAYQVTGRAGVRCKRRR